MICDGCLRDMKVVARGKCYTCYKKLLSSDGLKYKKPLIELTNRQNEIVIGSLLGDGGLEANVNSQRAALRIKRATRDIEYLEWQHNELFNFCHSPPTSRENIDSRDGVKTHSSSFNTAKCGQIYKFYQDWYYNGKKIIPNIQLTALTIAVWFCDDGFLRIKSKNSLEILFATNGFDPIEVQFLVNLLNDRYNAKFYLSTHSTGPVIYGSTKSVLPLLEDIKPVFPNGIERKLSCLANFDASKYGS